MSPHERPIAGPAADFAATLRAALPVLETARTRLRAPELGDFDLWAEIVTGPAGADIGGPFSREDAFTEFCAAVSLWLLRGHGLWTVEDRDGHEVLGFVLVGFEPGDLEPELGYLFRAAATGKGYAAEAAGAARDHALGAAGLPSLVSYVAPENAPSARLAERLGGWRDGEVDGCQVWRHAPKQGGRA